MKKSIFIFLVSVLVLACSDNGGNTAAVKPTPLPDSVLNERWKVIKAVEDRIREGDLVLRCGNDYTSETLRDFSQQEKLYSHSGIALMNDGIMYVYSNMAGDINPDEVMRRDKVDSFLTPSNNVAVGVYRYDITNEELEKLRTIVGDHYTNKLQFDMNFDLSTNNKIGLQPISARAILSVRC